MTDRMVEQMRNGRLEGWFQQYLPKAGPPLEIEQFSGGQSNPTFRVATPVGNFVLRRKPAGPLAPGAHAIEREARVMRALEDVGFPAPHVHALCLDETIIGAPFYVMEFVEGRIFWNAKLESVPLAQRRACFDSMNETLARLHNIDPVALGLEDFGKSGNYFARQTSRWSRQYQADEAAGQDANMDRLVEWLPQNIPEGEDVRIVHGDYRVDNLVFHPTEPKVIAVLDWELSTLGHPLADFVNHLMMYRLPQDILSGLSGADLSKLGLPSEKEYAFAYCARMNRTEVENLNFYLAFSIFRLAAIYHGIKARALRGNASSDEALQFSSNYPRLAELAWRTAQER